METRPMTEARAAEIEAAMKMINICPSSILAVEDQTLEMQLLAVSKAPELIEKITPLNSAVIEEAVRKDGRYLWRAISLNEDICLAAVENNGDALKYVPVVFQTTKVVNMAIKGYPRAILYAYSPSQESLELAVGMNPNLVFEFKESWNTAATIKAAVEKSINQGWFLEGEIAVSQLSPSEILWIASGINDDKKSEVIHFVANSIVATKNKKEEAARLAAEEDELY